jgi:anti-sigma factor RsiW
MNHPTREELIEFIYGELSQDRNTTVACHLETCAECRAQTETWNSVRRELAVCSRPGGHAGQAPARRLRAAWLALRWAAAAAVLLLAGYGLARLATSAPAEDPAALRAAVAEELRAELRADFARFAAEQSARQDGYREAFTQALGQIEARRALEYENLRRDMETVAMRAEDQFENTRRNMFRLASLER